MLSDNLPSPVTEGVLAATLFSFPFWIKAAHAVSVTAALVAGVCGAVVGLHAVYRIVRGRE